MCSNVQVVGAVLEVWEPVVTDGEDTEASVIAVVTLHVLPFTNPCHGDAWESAPWMVVAVQGAPHIPVF